MFNKNLRHNITALIFGIFLTVGVSAQTDKSGNGNQDTISPKKEGVTRVGVLLPKVSLNNVSKKVDPAVAVQNTFSALLNSDSIELIPLDASLKALAYKEARDKDCDYVLKINLSQKSKKKGNGFFNRILDKSADSAISESTSRIPTGNNVGGSVGREAAVGAGQEVSKVEFKIKKKDEFVLVYELADPKSKTVRENTLKAKAEKDDDDVLMPLIEEAANEIAEYLISQNL